MLLEIVDLTSEIKSRPKVLQVYTIGGVSSFAMSTTLVIFREALAHLGTERLESNPPPQLRRLERALTCKVKYHVQVTGKVLVGLS